MTDLISPVLSAASPARFFLIAGPCVIESQEHCLDLAGRLAGVAQDLDVPFVFKASFDKANRTSVRSYRGPGLDRGLEILGRVRQELRIPVTSDIHEAVQAEPAAKVLDILQIPAFLCRQTDLLTAAARTGCPVNVKKGQFLAPWDVRPLLEKLRTAGCQAPLITERGSSFGYNNLVVDFRGIPVIREMGCRVVFDATHSVQLPGGGGDRSSGQSRFIPDLARAAMAVGVDGIFFEVHDRPAEALSDGANSLPLEDFRQLLEDLCRLASAARPR